MKRCCSYVLSQLGVPHFFLELLVPSLSWSMLRSTTAFVSISDWCYSESFGLVYLDQELLHMSVFCWMSRHSSVLAPSPSSANRYFLSFSIRLEFEVAGNGDGWFYSSEGRSQFRAHAGAQKRLREEEHPASLSKDIRGLRSGNQLDLMETENFIQNICILNLN